jgi:hypothetical protein
MIRGAPVVFHLRKIELDIFSAGEGLEMEESQSG